MYLLVTKKKTGEKVYQSAKSNTRYSAKVSQLQEITTASDSVRMFTVSVGNIGDKVLECKIYLVASNLETAKEFRAKPIIIKLYPDKSKIATLTVPKGLTAGSYSLAAILDYGHRTDLEAITMEIKVD